RTVLMHSHLNSPPTDVKSGPRTTPFLIRLSGSGKDGDIRAGRPSCPGFHRFPRRHFDAPARGDSNLLPRTVHESAQGPRASPPIRDKIRPNLNPRNPLPSPQHPSLSI